MFECSGCAFCILILHDVFVMYVRSVDVHVSIVLYIVCSMHDLFVIVCNAGAVAMQLEAKRSRKVIPTLVQLASPIFGLASY